MFIYIIWMFLANAITIPYEYNWNQEDRLGSEMTQGEVVFRFLKLLLYEAYFVDFVVKTPQYSLHHCECHFKLSVPLQLLHQLSPVEYLFKHYHIHLTVLCAIYCRDETHKVASYTWWLKMLSQPFNLASQCCYVWWIAGLTYSSSDLIWIVACS